MEIEKGAYYVTGGVPLHGSVAVSGDKHAAIRMIVASSLSSRYVILENVPHAGVVEETLTLLRSIGMQAVWNGTTSLHLTMPHMTSSAIVPAYSRLQRIPMLLAGPLLHHTGQADIPFIPEGNPQARPIDFHVAGFTAMGADVRIEDNVLHLRAPKLEGATITLPYPSVVATETLLLAAVLAKGKTTLHNVALDPEIRDLIDLLQKMGAIIFHDPGRTLVIEGVPYLTEAEQHILPDRVEAALFACAAVATKGSVLVRGAVQHDLQTFLNVLRKIGGKFEVVEDGIRFAHEGPLRAVSIETDVHPGFVTDWQPLIGALLTQAEGQSFLHETVYEDRFRYLRALTTLGATITLSSECHGDIVCRFREKALPHTVSVTGPSSLHGGAVELEDSISGAAAFLGTLVAEGLSSVAGMRYLEQDFEHILEKFRSLGARVEESS